MKSVSKGMLVFPTTNILIEYSAEEEVRGLEVQFEWGTVIYTPDTFISMVKVINVYENHMVTVGHGKILQHRNT